MSISSIAAPKSVLLLPALALCAVLTQPISAQTKAAAGKLNEYGNPLKIAPRPTTAAISVADLQTRLYIFADDSMQGRQLGRIGNMRGTDYIAGELKKLGILPGANDGTYFQNFGFIQRAYTNASRMSVGGIPLSWNAEFVAVPSALAESRRIDSAEVIFGGVTGDSTRTITAEQAEGKVVLLLPRPAAPGGAPAGGRRGRGGGGQGGGAVAPPFPGAAAIVTVDLDALTPGSRVQLNNPAATRPGAAGGMVGGAAGGRGGGARGGANAPVTPTEPPAAPVVPPPAVRVTRAAAEKMLGRSLDGATPGTIGKKVTANLVLVARATNYARNVIGIIPGSDPKLKGQYVLVSGHNDHVGFANTVVADHDSARAFKSAVLRCQLEEGKGELVACPVEKVAAITVNMDSIRKIHPVARRDSINNGADDDGSGSMAVLEIAEAIAKMPVKPKRSTIFVWHTGEEGGMDGSRGFTADPSVPIDSIVTALNIDMIGRGRAEDIPGGGSNYLAVLGSRVISEDVGGIVDAVNARPTNKLKLDYKFDQTTAWPGYNNLYNRSDHVHYANAGIPIAFFFTGLHGDYHQVTDEPAYIDYPHYAKNAKFIFDVMVEIANRADRPAKKPIVP